MRQAVVVIHGIGEQQPMGTIRSFVDAVLVRVGDAPAYFSKPDKLSDLFELRRLQATGSKTDFYEYYWAYNVEGTKVWSVLLWILRLMFRLPNNIPPGVKAVWWLSWALLLSFVALLALGFLGPVADMIKNAGPFTLAGAIIFIVLSAIQFTVVYFIGDAARYLSPLPANINLRQKIRSQGLQLLRSLHESGKYSRIIIVGHSLGSVIGYDIISRLWVEHNDQLRALENDPAVKKRVAEAMAAEQPVQPLIREALSVAGEALYEATDLAGLRKFQDCQQQAWTEQAGLGNPWRITDFVTLGSPLAHAEMFLAANKDDFVTRKHQRECATCPPQRDVKGYAYSAKGSIEVDAATKRRFTPLLLHHAAPFAVTRWTNLYFPVKWGFFGDLVGGPLAPVFGPGIHDVPVTTRRGLDRSILAHVHYWYRPGKQQSQKGAKPSAPVTDNLDALNAALRLSELRKFPVPALHQPKP